MPLQKLVFKPGINREGTNYTNEGGFYECDKIRFRSGQVEKIGGWTRSSNAQFLGICRDLWNWIDLEGTNYLGLGTNLKYYIEKGGTYSDVTPIRQTFVSPATNNCFTTTAGSKNVTVTIASHGANPNDFVTFSGAVAVGGVPAGTLNQEFQIVSITVNTFVIKIGTAAVSTATGGGTGITAEFQLTTGLDIYVVGTGWGAGVWGRGTWGSASLIGIGEQLRLWSSDNYGQDLILAPRGGALYYWQDVLGVNVRAKALADLSTAEGFSGAYVPVATLRIVTSDIQRFVIAFGANPYTPGDPVTDFDPMLVRWSDQENPYQWVPDITNQSGEFRLSRGSTIITSVNARQEILVLTDSSIYSMQYLGPPYIWGFTMLMDNISIMSPNVVVTAANVTYWMGFGKFYMYSGSVATLPCSLRQFVFDNINLDQRFQFFGGSNEAFNEVWWYYCSENSSVIDTYVIYNYVDQIWYYGTLGRTAWLDSGIRTYPMAADYNGRILYHETSVDDEAGPAPAPIYSYVQSSDFDIGDGHNFGFVWRILPDVNFNGSNVNQPTVTMTVRPRQNAGAPYGAADNPAVQSADNYVTQREYVVQQFSGEVFTRIRGRQMAFRITSADLGVAWQLGNPRIDIRQDGRKS